MSNVPYGGRSNPRFSKASRNTLESCADPSHPDNIYKIYPEKSTTTRILCERVPCLFLYAPRRLLGGVHGTCVPSMAPTQFFKNIENNFREI